MSLDYDLVLEEIGEFGPWQRGVAALAWVPAAFVGVHSLMFSFTGKSLDGAGRCCLGAPLPYVLIHS